MDYTIRDINKIVSGQFLNTEIREADIRNIVFDTRKISFAKNALFVALKGAINDGHKYIAEAYGKGIRNFIVEKTLNSESYPNANFIKVDASIIAIQELAIFHRKKFEGSIIAITGSNGKTIIKEWLAECLNHYVNTFKSPLSYNSQLGVPLSLLQMDSDHEFSVIEAGISMPGEMYNHARTIQPKYGILSNIGDAHDSGFASKNEKLKEKLILFDSCQQLIYCKDHKLIDDYFQRFTKSILISWGENIAADIVITKKLKGPSHTLVELDYLNGSYTFSIPFVNTFLLENCMHVIAFLLTQKWSQDRIQLSIRHLKSLPNRLEIKEGKQNNLLINDSYSLDMASLQLALEYQDQYAKSLKKVLFISAFEQQHDLKATIGSLKNLIAQKSIQKLIAIGFEAGDIPDKSAETILYFKDTDDCLLNFDFDSLENNCILIKGARSFAFEKLFNHMSQQVHQTVLETNLNAVSRNIKTYRSLLKPTTKIMAVVKAEAYGSGSQQMAQFLETQNIDYLAVALIDEAIRIRESNCQLPIMVFNIQDDSLKEMWDYDLEPEIYSIAVLQRIALYAQSLQKEIKIHLKIDSGMHRLGILSDELDVMADILRGNRFLTVASIFSHLSASEEAIHDEYTTAQLHTFDSAYSKIAGILGYSPIKHILNTAGIVRFPQHQNDMVRMGLGLYGIDETNMIGSQLEMALCLTAKILQIKNLEKNQTTGYGRAGVALNKTKIAIISIGYADGFLRSAGNGRFYVNIKGQDYPTIGNICMDVSIIDISNAPDIKEGDDVIIFQNSEQLKALSKSAQTISYEIISRIAPRVKRVYVYN